MGRSSWSAQWLAGELLAGGSWLADQLRIAGGLWLASGFVLACQSSDGAAKVQPAAPEASSASTGGQPSLRSSADSSREPSSQKPSVQAPQEPARQSTSRNATRHAPNPNARRLRSEEKGFVVIIREDCSRGQADYDLLVHFHGVTDAVERQWNQSTLGGVLAVANAGTWGRDYKAVYEHSGAFKQLLERVDAQLRRLCPEAPPRAGRVALSGWSAGYAAVRAMIRDVGPEPIDTVLLSDGIHASLTSHSARAVLPEDVSPFVDFGKLAKERRKLLSITHSAIHTPDYASTTETTNHLLQQLGLQRTSVIDSPSLGSPSLGSPPGDAVHLVSEVRAGNVRVRGYSGNTGPDHGWHLHALDRTLFRDLRAWWSGDSAPHPGL
jgi:hypothetical protein